MNTRDALKKHMAKSDAKAHPDKDAVLLKGGGSVLSAMEKKFGKNLARVKWQQMHSKGK